MTRPLPFHALLIVVLLAGCSPTAPPQDAADKQRVAGQSHPEVAAATVAAATALQWGNAAQVRTITARQAVLLAIG
ncbi:MAG: hypothetical protein R3F36_10905 [Candidatus Competibacteraceae bacterium]